MPTPAWDDLDAFMNTADFAIEATVTLMADRHSSGGIVGEEVQNSSLMVMNGASACLIGAGTSYVVRGIFDDPYLNAQLGEYELDTSRPRFHCKEADVIGVLRGDTLTIGSKIYDVLTSAQPDGTGMAILELAPQGN